MCLDRRNDGVDLDQWIEHATKGNADGERKSLPYNNLCFDFYSPVVLDINPNLKRGLRGMP